QTTSTAPVAAPTITNIVPSSGPAGTLITIHGTGFAASSNFILFGDTNGRHHLDGSPDNSHANAPSPDGKTLTFQVPNTGPSGILCDGSNHCVGISAILLSAGSYKVEVQNANGTSNAVIFNLTQ